MKTARAWMLSGVVSLVACQLWGMLSLLLITVPGMAKPWTVFELLRLGFYPEVIASFLILSLASALVFAWHKGGVWRILSGYALAAIGIMSLGLVLGLLLTSMMAGGVIAIGLLLYIKKDAWFQENKALGDAHFSTGLELWRAGFLKREEGAILVGKKYDVPLWSNGFEHVLVFAPTGSGKTRSIGMPNLIQYPYSVVCNDVKLTLFKATAKHREQVLGHQCYCWAPAKTDGPSHRYNPLSMISTDKRQRITDIQRIAHILIPDSKKSDPIWQQASRKLFKAILLYLLDTPDRATTLGEINRVIKQQHFDEWLEAMLEECSNLDPAFYQNGYSYLNNHEKTRSSILETLSGYFELFEDPTVDNATSCSDFDVRDMRRKKITIYIGFTDDDMERLSPLLTLFWQQLISVMIQNVPDPKDEPYPMLCLIDEFSSLGRIERLRRSLKLLREYRVRCVLMLQYIAQTYEQYSHDEAKAFTNIKTKIAFAAEDLQDAEYISKLLGTRTVKVGAGSSSSQTQGYSESSSYNYQAVPLLRPDEVMRLPREVNLIMRTGNAPVKAGQFVR